MKSPSAGFESAASASSAIPAHDLPKPDCAPEPVELYRTLSIEQPDNYPHRLSPSYLKLRDIESAGAENLVFLVAVSRAPCVRKKATPIWRGFLLKD
jgi:hypothetical protein